MPHAQVHQRRSNKRGLATRQTMLDAAVRSLASGDPGAVSASRIAKESGATWGAVQYHMDPITWVAELNSLHHEWYGGEKQAVEVISLGASLAY